MRALRSIRTRTEMMGLLTADSGSIAHILRRRASTADITSTPGERKKKIGTSGRESRKEASRSNGFEMVYWAQVI